VKWCAACGRETFENDRSCDKCRGTRFTKAPPSRPSDPPRAEEDPATHQVRLEQYESAFAVAGCLLRLGVIAVVVGWIGYAFYYAPSHPAARDSVAVAGRSVRLLAVSVEMLAHVPPESLRLEAMQADNLEIFLAKGDLQRIAFPDRAGVLRRVGEAWCKGAEPWFLPTLRMRDIRTGERLGKYSCVFGSTSMPYD
jgi:hypothetical protein